MPVSTANYTTTEPLKPLMAAEVKYERPTSNSSVIVISWPQELSLNNRISKLLSEFEQLQNNWDNDDALAPSKSAIRMANYTSKLLSNCGQPIYHVAPGPNGEIMLDIRNSDLTKSLELIFYSERSVAVYFPKEGKPFQKDFVINDLQSLLSWLNSN